jgi:hypothetical protein
MLKYYGGFEAGEKPKADFPHEQHHYVKVCLDRLKLLPLALFLSLSKI